MSKSISPGTPRPERARFPKSSRIHVRREFELVRSKGRMVQGRFMRLGCLTGAGEEPARVGIITTKRLGGAVVRNAVRRRLREVFRLHCGALQKGILLVVVAKTGAPAADYAELRDEWLLLARKLSILPRS